MSRANVLATRKPPPERTARAETISLSATQPKQHSHFADPRKMGLPSVGRLSLLLETRRFAGNFAPLRDGRPRQSRPVRRASSATEKAASSGFAGSFRSSWRSAQIVICSAKSLTVVVGGGGDAETMVRIRTIDCVVGTSTTAENFSIRRASCEWGSCSTRWTPPPRFDSRSLLKDRAATVFRLRRQDHELSDRREPRGGDEHGPSAPSRGLSVISATPSLRFGSSSPVSSRGGCRVVPFVSALTSRRAHVCPRSSVDRKSLRQ